MDNRLSTPICTPKELAEMLRFFKARTLSEPIQLYSGCLIVNVPRMVEMHIRTLIRNRYKNTYRPYWDRLKELKLKISKND